jgi:hypothetical protein
MIYVALTRKDLGKAKILIQLSQDGLRKTAKDLRMLQLRLENGAS